MNVGNSILRLLHYPPVPKDGPHIRAGAHEDINVITLLLGAEEAGLEVKDHDGRWIAINPPAGSLVCNIGDMLQRLCNHRLPSTTHRVVNPAQARQFLTDWYGQSGDVSVFWGTVQDFVNELDRQRRPPRNTADPLFTARS